MTDTYKHTETVSQNSKNREKLVLVHVIFELSRETGNMTCYAAEKCFTDKHMKLAEKNVQIHGLRGTDWRSV